MRSLARFGKTWRISSGILLLGALAAAWLAYRSAEKFDTRFSGTYVLPDATLVFITPREGRVLRYRLMNGESSALWPIGGDAYEAGPGWAEREPVQLRVGFVREAGDRPATRMIWQRTGAPEQTARRLALPETTFRFPSGQLTLRGKLVTPEGIGPFAVVVIVHGSEKDSAVDSYFDPYLFATHGIAALVYDKRGTGESDGEYTQNFHVLAQDVLAAVTWLRSRADIDATRIHLAGFSQGGWIAPLAALRDGGIRSVLIGFGPLVPVTHEDRWGYVEALRKKGFGEEAIREADRLNEVIGAIFDRRENRWSELKALLAEARDRPWFEAVRNSDSALGYATGTRLPLWMVRLYFWWTIGRKHDQPFIDRLYDPVPTLAALDTPSLWILGGDDSSMPSQWTLEPLVKLQSAGRPIEYVLFPQTEHGILRFEELPDGERRMLGYAPDYLPLKVRWLRRQSGLE